MALYGLTYSSPDGSVGGEDAALRLEEVKERDTTPAVGCLRCERAQKGDIEGNCWVADAWWRVCDLDSTVETLRLKDKRGDRA